MANRIIKFRYWNGVSKIMVNNPEMPHKEGWTIEQLFSDRGWIWMQFTGLLDKNGKEIYEGDILKADVCEDGDEEILPVEFREGGFVLGYYDSALRYAENFEIIGNVWKNPELIKK